mgnify:CR=1 FL=1
MHRDVWLVARESRPTLPWACTMMRRVLVHTYVENTLPCLSLAPCCRKPETRGRNWSVDQLFWQADHPFWFLPQKVVGRWSPKPIAGRQPSHRFPGWSFSLLEPCAVFWGQLQTKASRGVARDCSTRRLEHACTLYHLRQSWGSPHSCSLYASLIAYLVSLLIN